jgi:hypothetical protein
MPAARRSVFRRRSTTCPNPRGRLGCRGRPPIRPAARSSFATRCRPVREQQSFVFAVQGRDDGGAITPKFDATTLHANNYAAITLDGSLLVGPSIVVHAREESLSAWSFGGIGAPAQVALVDSDTLTLFWDAPNASRYGARGRDARYGWKHRRRVGRPRVDVVQHRARRTAARSICGRDVFKIQCRDNIGQTTTATISFQHAAAKPERVASASRATKRERARAAAAVRR